MYARVSPGGETQSGEYVFSVVLVIRKKVVDKFKLIGYNEIVTPYYLSPLLDPLPY
jgi:hypothetical protein